MKILWRYIASEYFKAFLATLVGVCAIFLVVDYVDRAKTYAGGGWAVLELYAWKAVTVAYQLAPAALLLAGGVSLASMRRRGEYTALRALAVGPLSVLAPIVTICSLLVGGLVLADELVVGQASRRVDEISVQKFRTYGDWRMYFGENQWFRGKRHIYHFRGGDPDDGLRNVTVYTLSEDFRLAQRIDATRMIAVEGNRWRLEDGTQRTLGAEVSPIETFTEKEFVFDEGASAFRLTKGRPEQLPMRRLREQIRLRRNVGLPAERYVLAMHNRFAYPLGGLPGVILGFALVLRPGRRGSLTAALAEGFVIIIALWMLLVVFKAAALASLMAPATAAWMPIVLMSAAAALAVKRFAR